MTFSVWRDSTAYKPPYRSPHTPAGIIVFSRLGREVAMGALIRRGYAEDYAMAERILAGRVPGYMVRAHIDCEEL